MGWLQDVMVVVVVVFCVGLITELLLLIEANCCRRLLIFEAFGQKLRTPVVFLHKSLWASF